MSAEKTAKKTPAKKAAAKETPGKGGASAAKKAGKAFDADERAAMKERAAEVKRAASGKSDGEADVLGKIAEMAEPERTMATRLHALIKATAPTLTAKTWYGMPAYSKPDGKMVCFFQSASKFKSRYATLGFSDEAKLDDGALWPTAYALKELTKATEAQVAALVRRALG